ncbi:hypothetical protein TrVFT333_010594 [Trichoderma virens FT-333]|nr:hypothetical protein TrVFT333_010594 [Trichoderma virens FT-333]
MALMIPFTHKIGQREQRAIITAILSVTTFITTFASVIYAPDISTIAADYKVAPEVATLGVTLYVLGFSAGPVLWGPLSEIKGRRLRLVVAAFGTAIFHFAVAVSKDLQSIMINRFFAGFFGTGPLAVGGAVFVDLFDNKTRSIAYYPPIILARKAAELRRRTENWAIHAKQEETEVDFHEMVERNLIRPLRMLVVEPIVLLISLYFAFIYGLLYLFLTAYPIIFQGAYSMRPGISGLPELGAVLGCILTGVIMVLRAPAYRRKLEANNNMPIPEWRLPEAMVGVVLFAGGMFWLG